MFSAGKHQLTTSKTKHRPPGATQNRNRKNSSKRKDDDDQTRESERLAFLLDMVSHWFSKEPINGAQSTDSVTQATFQSESGVP